MPIYVKSGQYGKVNSSEKMRLSHVTFIDQAVSLCNRVRDVLARLPGRSQCCHQKADKVAAQCKWANLTLHGRNYKISHHPY